MGEGGGRRGRRDVLRLGAGAMLLPAAARAQGGAEVGALTIPPPPGTVRAALDDEWRAMVAAGFGPGVMLLDAFYGPSLTLVAATVPALTGDRAAQSAALAEEAAQFAAFAAEAPGPRPYGGYEDLRFERGLSTDETLLWLGMGLRMNGLADDDALVIAGALIVGGQDLSLMGGGSDLRGTPARHGAAARAAWDVLIAWASAIRKANRAG